MPAHQASRHNHPRPPQEPPLHDHTHQAEDIFGRASSADKASDPGIVDPEAISVDTDGTGEMQCACMVGQKNSLNLSCRHDTVCVCVHAFACIQRAQGIKEVDMLMSCYSKQTCRWKAIA